MEVMIWIHDNVEGAFPLRMIIKRDGDKIILSAAQMTVDIPIEAVMSVLGDEGHG